MTTSRLQEIRAARRRKRQALIDAGQDPYPAEARRTHTTTQVLSNFRQLQSDTTPLILTGRVMSIRRHGKVMFIDLMDAYGQIQLQINQPNVSEQVYQTASDIDIGDFIQTTGQATTTERGVQTVLVNSWHWLAKNIRPLPDKWYGLKDTEKRYRHRELDLLLNEQARLPIIIKSEVISWLRRYLKEKGFLEVETPTLQPQAGGAAAQPFVTHHNSLNTDLYLRIAPELYLKRLLIGGLEKVFEIGKNFRNEGIDKRHNPEFTACEFYWSYADYEDLTPFTEKMLTQLVKDIKGTTKIKYGQRQINFDSPWEKVSFVNYWQEHFALDILTQKNPSAYLAVFNQHKLPVPAVKTIGKLIDELYQKLIRPKLINPTILYDYPVELAPLAKNKAQDRRVVEALQLVVAGTELVWAYSELNDPVEQELRFKAQQKDKAQGDKEVPELDEDYLKAMEYGMPPAAGWGMGVDRLAAILSDTNSIRDTITFPLLRPENLSHD